MAISKELKVGVLAAAAISILAFGYNFMKGQDLFTSTNEYFGKYDRIDREIERKERFLTVLTGNINISRKNNNNNKNQLLHCCVSIYFLYNNYYTVG